MDHMNLHVSITSIRNHSLFVSMFNCINVSVHFGFMQDAHSITDF